MLRTTVDTKFHETIAQALQHNGAEVIFGVLGDANLYMMDSFVRFYGGRYISASHEAGAALMALGYSMTSGRTGIATVTHGPALVNTMTALGEGVKGGIPMILVAGDTALDDRAHSQNVPQRELVTVTGAGFEQVRSPDTLSEDVATAFRRTVVERRPVVLNIPINFQFMNAPYRPLKSRIADHTAMVPASTDLDDAIGIIAASSRPIIIAGRGAIRPEAREALLRLGSRIGALMATTLKAKDLFHGERANMGIFGSLSTPPAAEAIAASDCIISFGAALNFRTTARGALLKGKRVIQVGLDRSDLANNVDPDVTIFGDAALTADLFVKWLDEAEIARPGVWADETLSSLASYRLLDGRPDVSGSGTVDISRSLLRINDIVPADRVLVTDAGRFIGITWKAVHVEHPRRFVYTANSGSIGLGMGEAIGAAFASPKRPVLLVTGDGGFMHGGLAEFSTAVRAKVDLIVVVCNDQSYGAEYIQFQARNMDPAMSLFDWPNFAPVAESLGGRGLTVRSLSDLDTVERAVNERDRPILVDLKLDPATMPPVEG